MEVLKDWDDIGSRLDKIQAGEPVALYVGQTSTHSRLFLFRMPQRKLYFSVRAENYGDISSIYHVTLNGVDFPVYDMEIHTALGTRLKGTKIPGKSELSDLLKTPKGQLHLTHEGFWKNNAFSILVGEEQIKCLAIAKKNDTYEKDYASHIEEFLRKYKELPC